MKTEYWTTTVWLRGKGFLDYYCSFSCNFSNLMLLPVLQEKQLLLFAAPANWCRYPWLWRPGDTTWLHLIWHLLLSFSALMKSISKLSGRVKGQGFSSCLNLHNCLRARSCSTREAKTCTLSAVSLVITEKDLAGQWWKWGFSPVALLPSTACKGPLLTAITLPAELPNSAKLTYSPFYPSHAPSPYPL